MAKKLLLITAVFFTALPVFSAPQKPAFPAGAEMYPAIYGAFSQLYPNARYLDIDFYNNKYVVTGITGYALTTPISYDMIVQLNGNGQLEITYADIWGQDANRRWARQRAFGFYSFDKAANSVSAKMVEIANNPATFEQYKKDAMVDIKFVYTVLKNFTGLAFKDFIDTYAKGSIFNITGNIADVKESGKEASGEKFKYVVTLTQKLRGDDSSGYFSSSLSEFVYCTFYTNRDDVVRLSKTSVTTVKGSLTGAATSASGLSLELVDAN